MIPVTDAFKAAVRLSHSYLTQVDAYTYRDDGTQEIIENIPITRGSVTSDRGSQSRLSCAIEVSLETWKSLNVNALTSRLKIFRGLNLGQRKELLQLGEFRVDNIRRTGTQAVAVTGVGLENYVIDSQFLRPWVPQIGVKYTDNIIALINEAMPTVPEIVLMNPTDEMVRVAQPWDKERWGAIQSMASAIGAEVFVNNTGKFIVQKIPEISRDQVKFVLNVGFTVYTGPTIPGIIKTGDVLPGAISESSVSSTRTAVYNAIVATGESTDSAIQPFSAVAYDTDPTSPTRWGGPFGKIPGFITSPYYTSPESCLYAAQESLSLALAKSRDVSVSVLPLIYPEAGDVFELILEPGSSEYHMIQTITTSLTSEASAITTLSSKRDVGSEG